MNLKQLKAKIKQVDIKPSKQKGQNFLINQEIIHSIIKASIKLSPKMILEPGPGLGALTEPLLLLKPSKYLGIELDKKIHHFWLKKNITVIYGNILKIPWEKHLIPHSIMVGNLSYQIASRLFIQTCLKKKNLKGMVLMFQAEVADKILAKPRTKQYSPLSVMAQCFWNIKKICKASPQAFYPKPKVLSTVLSFTKKPEPYIAPEKLLFLLNLSFKERRKKLITKLKKTYPQSTVLFDKLQLSHNVRAEELAVSQFISLLKELS